MPRINKEAIAFPQPSLFSYGGSSWSPSPTWSETLTRVEEHRTVGFACPPPPPSHPPLQPFSKQKKTMLSYHSAAQWDRSSRSCAWGSFWLWPSPLIYARTPAGSKSFPVYPLRGFPGHDLSQCLLYDSYHHPTYYVFIFVPICCLSTQYLE